MILIWRGGGLLAAAALIPLLASCAGLMSADTVWLTLAATYLSLLAGGAVCIYYGSRWNRPVVEHTLYFVPLRVWGWIYLGAAALLALVTFAGGAYQTVRPLPNRPAPAVLLAVGGVGLVAATATGWWLVRAGRPRRSSGEDRPDGDDRPGRRMRDDGW